MASIERVAFPAQLFEQKFNLWIVSLLTLYANFAFIA